MSGGPGSGAAPGLGPGFGPGGRLADGPSLDPEDWDGFAELAHRVLDAVLDLQKNASSGPAWQPMPDEVRARLREPAPRSATAPDAIWSDVRKLVVPYRTGNIHPRFWGWVSGTGTPMGMLAELIAGGMNQVSGIFNDSARAVHGQVIQWMKELFGFPEGSTGVLVGGGSVANWVGLAAAREARGGARPGDVARTGLQGRDRPLVLYASSEVHQSVDKAVQLLGLGRDALRKIPVDDEYRLPLGALEEAVKEDRAAGLEPFAVVANAGTVNTGAIDDMEALADFCAAHRLWFHVDGAFGAVVALAPSLRDRLKGMERADSLACDFHKWLYVQYEASFVLVRDAAAHRAAFSVPADYLVEMERGVGAAPTVSTSDVGPQLSRGFKALKVWMSLREHGVAGYAAVIERNVAQAAYLARRVEETAGLELSAPAELNVVCFRWVGRGADGGDPAATEGAADPSGGGSGTSADGSPPTGRAELLDELNREVVMRLHEDGVAVPSYTMLGGRFVIRVAITNHRTRRKDLDILVDAVRRVARELDPREEAS